MCVKLSTIPKGISGKNLELLEPKYEDGSNKSVRVMLCTLIVIKTDNFLFNVSGHLDVQGGAYVS